MSAQFCPVTEIDGKKVEVMKKLICFVKSELILFIILTLFNIAENSIVNTIKIWEMKLF